MLLSSVILVLQETLEVALLVSVLLTISYQLWNRMGWVLYGLGGGAILSVTFAGNMVEISTWFDYVGQEIVNALLQTLTTILIIACTWALFKSRNSAEHADKDAKNRYSTMFVYFAMAAVALTIAREESEILLYLGGFFQQGDYFQTILSGSAIGFGIGVSTGVLLYYGLLSLPGRFRLNTPVVLLALFAGNMLSQASLQLTQADWISSARSFWDSSGWLPENSISGQLLYALIGYEATPSAVQVMAYGTGVLLVMTFSWIGRYPNGTNLMINHVDK